MKRLFRKSVSPVGTRRPAFWAWSLPMMTMLAAPGAAQTKSDDQAVPDQNTVIVTGRRETTEKTAQKFVRKTVTTNEGQLARFIDPVCPQILGLPASAASAIEDRIRRKALAAKVPVAPEKCDPNLIAVFAKNADEVMGFLRKHNADLFADLTSADLHDALSSGKVHSWRLTETRDEDGNPAEGVVDEDGVQTGAVSVESQGSTVFSPATQEATNNAVVVLDKSVVLDKTIAQLSDYIVMRTLAGARPPKADDKEGFATILSLFDPGTTPPKQMTSLDIGLLTGLYGSDSVANASSQAFDISRRMAGKSGPDAHPK